MCNRGTSFCVVGINLFGEEVYVVLSRRQAKVHLAVFLFVF